MTGDADRALIDRETERLKARGTDQDIALASLLDAVPPDVAATFLRDELLRALGGEQKVPYWLRIQELNYFAHRERRKRNPRWRQGPSGSVMATVDDR